MNEALIVVDMQNDFLPGGALGVPGGDEIIFNINELIEIFPLVIATQDWHPADHKSFASNHPGKNVFELIDLNGTKQILWPDHCVQGSMGAAFTSKINFYKVEAIFRKGADPEIDSYSGFFDNQHLKSTGLAAYLKDGRKVKKVYLAGLAGDFCVNFSALDALDLGFDVVVIEDATKFINDDKREEIFATLKDAGAKILSADEVIRSLQDQY